LSADRKSAAQEMLARTVGTQRGTILRAAEIDNINLRGNRIEQIITTASNLHSLEDLAFGLGELRLLVDVKTKLLNLASSPKGYNIDKLLIQLSNGNCSLSFFFVGIDSQERSVVTRLVSVLDNAILKATRIQFHWAGRNSRGVTQLIGDLSPIFLPAFRERIDSASADLFLKKLVNL
jgi:hypothetical protein